MTVFENGTYLTVGELKSKLSGIQDSVPVCVSYDGRQPVVNAIPSLGTNDEVVVLALQVSNPDDIVEVDFDK